MAYGHAWFSMEFGENLLDPDAIAVDAFSGDAIPVHLSPLTAEGVHQALCSGTLSPGGIIAFHISNTYRSSCACGAGTGRPCGSACGGWYRLRTMMTRPCVSSSDWVLVTANGKIPTLPEIADAILRLIRNSACGCGLTLTAVLLPILNFHAAPKKDPNERWGGHRSAHPVILESVAFLPFETYFDVKASNGRKQSCLACRSGGNTTQGINRSKFGGQI